MKNVTFLPTELAGFSDRTLLVSEANVQKGSIEMESHLPGLTDKIKHMLEAK